MFGRYFATEKALRCKPNDHCKFANSTKCLLVPTSEVYGRYVEHVKRVEENYSETDRIADLNIDQLLITIGRKSSSDPECNWYGSSEDESN